MQDQALGTYLLVKASLFKEASAERWERGGSSTMIYLRCCSAHVWLAEAVLCGAMTEAEASRPGPKS